MPTAYTDVDRLILDRWDDTRGLLEAYEELQDRMQDTIEEIGNRLERWAEERGYTFGTDAKGPQFYAHKPSWMNRRKDDALVYFNLIDFAPVGYRRVKESHPSMWVHTENLQMMRLKEADRAQFAKALRGRLGDTVKSWHHEDANDSEYPLGKMLAHVTDAERVQLIADPERLYGFAVEAFEDAFKLAPVIDDTLAEFKARE